MRRNTRRRLAAWMIGTLLFTQCLAVAYACPALAGSLAGSDVAVAAQVARDCHGKAAAAMDAENPALCKGHCDADRQAPSRAAAGDAPALAPMWFIFPAFELFDATGQPAHRQAVAQSAAPPGWPPLYLIYGALRS